MLEFSGKPVNQGTTIHRLISRSLLFCLYLCGVLISTTVQAQEPAPDWEKRQRADERLKVFGSDLLGDGIDPNTGTIQFSTTDVSIPGNFPLPVSITRKLSPGRFYGRNVSAEFGDWQIEVPRIHVLTRTGYNWTGNRCTNTFDQSFPSHQFGQYTTWYRKDYTNGLTMDIPGQGSKGVLELLGPNTNLWPSDTEMVTVDGWRLTCGSANNGQGFIGHSPDGSKYRFDRFITLEADPMGSRVGDGPTMLRTRNILAATQVTDVNGNTVNYDYDGYGRLTAIRSSDSRRINLTYNGASKLIRSVTSNPGTSEARTWTYSYAQKTFPEIYNDGTVASSLISVTQPDGLYWSYDMAGMSADPGIGDHCPQTSQTVSVTHPHGVTGTFKIGQTHQRSSYQLQEVESYNCPGIPDVTPGLPVWKLAIAKIMSVYEKKLSGPDMQDQVWNYLYEADLGPANTSGDDRTNTTTVTGPESIQMVYRHYWPAEPFGGKMASVEVKKNGNVLRRTDYTYQKEGAYGAPIVNSGRTPSSGHLPTHTVKSVMAQDGDTYTNDTSYITDQNASDYSYSRPAQTSVYSNVSTTPRVTDTTYENKTAKWILSLPLTVTTNGRDMATYDYDDFGRKITETRGGAAYATYAYYGGGDKRGAMYWVEDALGRRTSAYSWKRGTPQRIKRPDLNSVYQYVDDNGWLTSTKDANGNTTSYDRDPMGRLTTYTPPTGWTPTTIDYSFSGTITQTIGKGLAETIITYDSMFRPTLVETTDSTPVIGSSSFVSTTYDAAGRAVFTSLPSDNANETDGTTTTYDGLGRVTSTSENVFPFVVTSTDYLDLHRVRTTDPLNNQTTTYLDGYAGPGKGDVIHIKQPEDVNTQIYRNPWGQIDRVRQYGTGDGGYKSEDHYYNYNPKHQLCRHFTQSGRGVVYAYDDAGQMIAYNRGKGYGITCDTPTGADLVDLSYDVLGRLITTDYTDPNTPDIARSYDKNGNVKTVNRGSGTDAVDWTYTYDMLNNLTSENLSVDGGAKTFDMSYGYNPDGFMSMRSLPSGRVLAMTNDGLGRLNKIHQSTPAVDQGTGGNGPDPYQVYADNISYHASGSITSMDYGNGQMFTQSLTPRLQPLHMLSTKGSDKALDLLYTYDARGKVIDIDNGAILGGSDDRTYNYDGLGRLTSATGSWGSSSYKYDVLGNILEKQVGARTIEMTYNGVNRLTSHVDLDAGGAPITSTKRILSYDSHGNVSWLGSQRFRYDAAEQPYRILGTVIGDYVYDGNLKRVKSVIAGKTIYNVYDASGTLVHVDEHTDGKYTDYIGKIARVTNGGWATWLHMDHLGSAQTGTDMFGMVSWREQYTPYGTTLTNPLSNNDQAGFTGHIKDSATGLNYMQARYYDPLIGRFLSIDPVGFSVGQPQMFNRFSYTYNDPVNLIDSNGLSPTYPSSIYWNSSLTTLQAASDSIAAVIFGKNFVQLKIKSIIRKDDRTFGRGDWYHHCKANCETTTLLGPFGASSARRLSDWKEKRDLQKEKNTPIASAEDQQANSTGATAGLNGENCPVTCADYARTAPGGNPNFVDGYLPNGNNVSINFTSSSTATVTVTGSAPTGTRIKPRKTYSCSTGEGGKTTCN